MRRSIQPCGRRGSAQAARTSSKAVSTRISKVRAERRSDRDTRIASSRSTPRLAGHHQPTERPSGIGNSPDRYAASSVPGSRSAPTATRSLLSWAAKSGSSSGPCVGRVVEHRQRSELLPAGEDPRRRRRLDGTGHWVVTDEASASAVPSTDGHCRPAQVKNSAAFAFSSASSPGTSPLSSPKARSASA